MIEVFFHNTFAHLPSGELVQYTKITSCE